MKNISIIGLGYVGLPLALLAAQKGHRVTGVDLDKAKVKGINNGIDPIKDSFVAKYIKNTRFRATTSADNISQSDIIIVCVPTPVQNDYQPDLRPLKGAVSAISEKLNKDTLIIIESTINPGVSDEIVIPLIEKVSGLSVNKDFYVSHCPERINPGDKKWNVTNIPRVAGSSHKKGLDRTVAFYKSIIDAGIKPMGSLKEAEAVKVVENSFRDINIAFVNELAKSFTKLGINVKNVIDGAATKPFAFMPHYPSIGVGGHCIPVDPYYLIEYARGHGFEHEFLSLARSINNSMPAFTVNQLTDGLNEIGKSLKNTPIAVLGLAYKPNIADDRESPTYEAIDILKMKGATVKVYDPFFPDKSTEPDLDSTLSGSVAVLLATSHSKFMNVDFKKHGIQVVVDGHNSLNVKQIQNAGIIYRGIGANTT